MNRKGKIIVSVVGIFIVLLALVGITYGYFLTRIQGNTNTTSISVTTADLKLTYGDGNGKIEPEGLIEPGFNKTKTFTVKNDGNAIVSYSIIFEDVNNNFERTEDWEYILRKDGESDPVATGTINRLEVQTILANIEIAVGVTDSYTLEVTYKETNTDQSIDMNKHLSLLVNIIEASAWDKAGNGTLLNAIKNNNVLSAPSTMPGGHGSGYKITPTVISMDHRIGIEDNYEITYGTGYTYDEELGTFNLTGVSTCIYSECYRNLVGKYISNNSTMDNSLSKTSNLNRIFVIEETSTDIFSVDYLLTAYNEIEESVLATTKDDYGISYYFRGAVDNNYVNFSGMCWRIVRVQGDGGIKLVLADRDNLCNNGYVPSETGDKSYITATSERVYEYIRAKDEITEVFNETNVAKVLNSWINGGTYKYIDVNEYAEATEDGVFESQITKEEQEKYLMNANWCNDVSISEIDDKNNIFYGSYNRLFSYERKPSLKCDFVGLNNSKSEVVKNNIGLLTGDEIAFAGGANYISVTYTNSYLKDNARVYDDFYEQIWTMSPISKSSSSIMGIVSYENNILLKEQLRTNGDWAAIRPAIVLKSNVLVTTNSNLEFEVGTYQNPYVIN